MTIKIGINGFGRIGRLVFRAALKHPDVEVVAINDLTDAATMAHLLTYDSVHGKLELNRPPKKMPSKSTDAPSPIPPYRTLKNWTGKHLVWILPPNARGFSGIAKMPPNILRQAPAKSLFPPRPRTRTSPSLWASIQIHYDPRQHHIISNASCTTNCLAPVAKVLLENFGIKAGLMTTIHSYTGDQRLLDFPHKDLSRARAAALSMIPTTTGAAKAVALVLPELAGKLNGLAIRVPTPNVSIVDLVATIEKRVSPFRM